MTTYSKTLEQKIELAYNSLSELSKKDGDAAIARRELYYILDRVRRSLPMGCVGGDVCGVDGTCLTQVEGIGFCKF